MFQDVWFYKSRTIVLWMYLGSILGRAVVFEICFGIIDVLQLNDGVVSSERAPSQGGASGCNRRTTNLDTPTRTLQNVKDKHADQPANKRATHVPHPRVASVEPPWLETTHFQKCMHRAYTKQWCGFNSVHY